MPAFNTAQAIRAGPAGLSSKCERSRRVLWPTLIVAAVAGAYANRLSGPMILDDSAIIAGNPTIRTLRHLGQVLRPPRGGVPVQGRPLFNLTLAINYALGQNHVRGYHLFNVDA